MLFKSWNRNAAGNASLLIQLHFLIKDTEVHLLCMQIGSTVKFVLLGVKSHLRPTSGNYWGLNHGMVKGT